MSWTTSPNTTSRRPWSSQPNGIESTSTSSRRSFLVVLRWRRGRDGGGASSPVRVPPQLFLGLATRLETNRPFSLSSTTTGHTFLSLRPPLASADAFEYG